MDKEPAYRSYLLRLWPAETDGKTWRASLECVQTKETRGFETLDEMCEYLRKQTMEKAESAEIIR